MVQPLCKTTWLFLTKLNIWSSIALLGIYRNELKICCCCFSVTKSCLTLQPHGLQHNRLPCPSLCLRVCSNLCPLSQSCSLSITPSATLFSFCLQFFPASESFPMSWLFTSGSLQSIMSTQKPTCECLYQLYSKLPTLESNQDVLQ